MVKKIKYLVLALLAFLIIPNVNAKEQVNLYLFWGDGCPHCEAEQGYLEDLQKEFDNLKIQKYEVWHNEENNQFMKQISKETNKSLNGVPVTIIGQTIITGFSDATEQEIRRAVSYYSENKHHNIVKEIQEGTYKTVEEIPDEEFAKEEAKLSEKTTIKLPIIKEVNFKNFELSTTIPILGVLASLSLPVIWLIITFASTISIQKEKETKIRLLSLGLVLMAISSLLSAILKLDYINWICRISILCMCLLLIINKFQKLNLPNTLLKTIAIVSAIMIGWLTPTEYWSVLNELINTQSLSIIMKILSNIYYLFSYLIPYVLILLICHIPWKKISTETHELIQISVWVATMLIVIFV